MATVAEAGVTKGAKIGFGIGGGVVAVIGVLGSWLAAIVGLLALLGTPLFIIMGGSAELAWLTHSDPAQRHLRLIAPPVLDAHFSDSPILVTIPLFTFVGYVLAEAKTPDRLVRGARSMVGWMPGGLAIVCVIASAVFTLLTGGSGVTIIAIGGLLYPALRKQGYSERFSLGLVTSGGSVGLLLPFSLPLMIFALVANVDYLMAFKAVVVPGVMVIVMLSMYAAFIGWREKVKREPPRASEIGRAVWELKWELMIPLILVAGLGSGLTAIDEVAGAVALYTVIIEFFLYKDLNWKKDMPRIVRASMTMAGAIIMILAMANAVMGYVVDEHIPTKVLDVMLKMGIEHRWQFLIVMNIFLLILGMLMEGFSAILIAVPLLLPFVAGLGARHPEEAMSPFQLAMIFILNLELAYCMPPLGLNLFIGSFRFNKPVAQLYRVVLPFLGVLAVALLLVSYIPWISDVAVRGDIAKLRAKAAEDNTAPKAAWMLECVQDDPTDPKPCSVEDRKKWAVAELPEEGDPAVPTAPTGTADGGTEPCDPDQGPCEAAGDAGSAEPCNPDFGDCTKAGGPAPPTKEKEECNPDLGDCGDASTP